MATAFPFLIFHPLITLMTQIFFFIHLRLLRHPADEKMPLRQRDNDKSRDIAF